MLSPLFPSGFRLYRVMLQNMRLFQHQPLSDSLQKQDGEFV